MIVATPRFRELRKGYRVEIKKAFHDMFAMRAGQQINLENVAKALDNLLVALQEPTQEAVVVAVDDIYAFDGVQICVILNERPGVLYPIRGDDWTPVIGETVTLHMPPDDFYYVTQVLCGATN